MSLTFGSLFAGVGGFDLGFEQAGFKCRFQVEWDPHCQQTLAHHWPDVPRWGDVSQVNGADLPPVDVITYGFPCQDLSVAGNRAGLDGNRSGLFFEAVRIIREMREATDGRFPTWAVAENVAGLLNADNGHAMGRCVDELAEAGSLVIEWCLVDAQWFGVPQRRRRVFLASCFDSATAERCPDPLFPVADSGARNPAEVKQAWETVTGDVADSVGECGQSVDTDRMTVAPYRMLGLRHYADGESASTLKNRDYKDSTDLVAFVKAKRAQTCAETSGALLARDHKDINTDGLDSKLIVQHDPAATLRSGGDGGVPSSRSEHLVAFSHTQGIDVQASEHHWPTLRTEGGGQAVAGSDLAVRRLTPLECERLMGWPDNHTLPRADGKLNSDSTRYRMCGNGVVAPVARWIAKQLRATL